MGVLFKGITAVTVEKRPHFPRRLCTHPVVRQPWLFSLIRAPLSLVSPPSYPIYNATGHLLKAHSPNSTGALTSFYIPSPPRPRNNFSVRNKFIPHFLTAMSQIQHLAFASRRFPFYPSILRRVLGWAGIGARPDLERSSQLATRGRDWGRGVRGA